MKDGLQLRDNAKAELMQIKSIEEGVTYLNKLESVAIWVMKEKKDAELSNMVSEQKLRTQRILGELIKTGQENGELRKQEHTPTTAPSTSKTLGEIGVNKKQSSAFQAIASIPEETFESFIEEKKAAVNNAVAELTTSGAVKLAKSLKEKKQDLDTVADVNARLDMERELRDLSTDLKKKYNRDQIELLIKFLTK
jgi:arginine repressor